MVCMAFERLTHAGQVMRQPRLITGEQLRAAYLDDAMRCYFRRKLPEVRESELLVRIEETLKFLFISDECTGAIPVTTEIDDIWHYWILQTQQYKQLCESLPGGGYIDHSSNDYLAFFDPAVGEEDDLNNEVRMLALYTRNFGRFEVEPAKYWRLARHLTTGLGWSIDELNDWLA